MASHDRPTAADRSRYHIEVLSRLVELGRSLLQDLAERDDPAARLAHAQIARSVAQAVALARRIESRARLPCRLHTGCQFEPEVAVALARAGGRGRRSQPGKIDLSRPSGSLPSNKRGKGRLHSE